MRESKQQEIPSRYDENWIAALDNRTALSKAVNNRLQELTQDLGGLDQLSYQQRSLAKRAIWTEAILEKQEAALSRGEDVEQGRMTQAINSLIGLYRVLGMERVPVDVLELSDYLAGKGK